MEAIEQFYGTISGYLPGMLYAAFLAFQVTILAILLSWVLGLAAALMKNSSSAVVRLPAEFYIWFIRGTPSLIQIFIIYFRVAAIRLEAVADHRRHHRRWG